MEAIVFIALAFVFVFTIVAFVIGVSGKQYQRTISENSLCPACGHRGCKLEFVCPTMSALDDKGRSRFNIEEARVVRICDTCSARAYETTVVDPKKWIAP